MAEHDPTTLVELLSHAVESSLVAQTIGQITTYVTQSFDTPHAGVTPTRHGAIIQVPRRIIDEVTPGQTSS